MRLFVLYDRNGTIRSAMKVEVMGEALDHPYGLLEDGEAVLEAKPTGELEKLASGEICARFVVDPQRQELVAKGAPPPSGRGGRRRRSGRIRRVPMRRAFWTEASAMRRMTRLHQAARPEGARARAVPATNAKPAATAAPAPLVALQQSIGNRAVGRLVQAKLKVARPGDRFEREADRVADQILRMPDGAAPAAIAGGAASVNAARAGRDSAGNGLVGGADGPVALPTPGPGVQAALSGGAAGSPLPLAARAFFEPRVGADLSAVRLHTGPAAGTAAAEIGAKAFTYGQNIHFGHGRFAPESGEGQRLLAHELVHTVQQADGSGGLIQADFESDFEGRCEIPVSQTVVVPPRTVRLTNPNGEAVWAPYGIYRPSEVPQAYQDRIMEATKAYQWRNPDEAPLVAREIDTARGANAGELTVRDMTRLAERRGRWMNIRVMMARVGKDFHFVGYDISRGFAGGKVDTGFVESEPGTRFVGQRLFADRVVRALQSGAPAMDLEVWSSQRTEAFHVRIYELIGRKGPPEQGTTYTLTPREMIRVALAWSEELSPAQRSQLVPLAAGANEPTEADAQRRDAAAARRRPRRQPKGAHPAGARPRRRPPSRSADRRPPSRSARRLLPRQEGPSRSQLPRARLPRKRAPKPQLSRVEPKVTFTPGTSRTGPTPEIARTAVAIEPLPARAQVRTTVAAAGATALLASLLNSVRGAEAAKAQKRLEELLREAEPLRWRGNAVVLQVVAEVPNSVDPFAKVTKVGDPGQVVYFKSMDIVGVFRRRASVSNQPTMSPNLARRNPKQKDPHEWTLTQQIEAQMGEKYPVKEMRPRPGFHYVSRQLHLEPFDTPEVTMVIGAKVPTTARTHPVPAWIAEKFPSLSTYSYVIAEGKMGFVDPNTNEIKLIVDVYPSQRP